jgi:hypothetical protein
VAGQARHVAVCGDPADRDALHHSKHPASEPCVTGQC